MKNCTIQDFFQPPSGGDVTIHLYSVIGITVGQNLFLDHAGSYIVQIIDYARNFVLARRYGASDDRPDGMLIPAGTDICGSYVPGPDAIVPKDFAGTLSGSHVGMLISPKEMEELKTLRALRDHLKKKAEEAEMAGRNKDPNLIAEKARNAKRAPWFVRAVAAQEMTELVQNLNQLQGLELHDAVSRAAALYYEEDPTVAGMVTAALSCFPGEPSTYYASIVRYTGAGGAGKQVVGACKAPGLEAAIRGAARSWLDELQAAWRKRVEGTAEQEANDAQESLDMENLLTQSLEECKPLAKLKLGEPEPAFPRVGDTVQVFAPEEPVFGGTPLVLGSPIAGTIGDGLRVKA